MKSSKLLQIIKLFVDHEEKHQNILHL